MDPVVPIESVPIEPIRSIGHGAMMSLLITASSLVTFLTLIHLIRLYLLFHFKINWTRFKADVSLSTLSCIMFTTLAVLFWVDKAPVGREVLLQLSAIPPTLQAFLRIDFQQRRLPTLPGCVLIVCPILAALSSVVKAAMAITGTFYWDRLHWGILYILCLDYLGVVFWYWWLVGQVLQDRTRLQMIALYVSVMVLLLLATAAAGTVWKLWVIALEVQLVFIAIWSIFQQFLFG